MGDLGGYVMNETSGGKGIGTGGDAGNPTRYYKKDFWKEENLKYAQPHHRLKKSARIINRIARGESRTLLDVGCGPATLMRLLDPNIKYYGIDISIHEPAPNLIESDFVEAPIRFSDKKFDMIVAQGIFEYIGDFQSQKFEEIAGLLEGNGKFILSYVNFGHRDKDIYWPYNNVQSFEDFRKALERYFNVDRFLPTSHNWKHSEPNRKLVRAVNMHINANIPIISRMLAVEYFFICSSRA
jgi:cyclopropane fatty-acyl-phospholipid synthase-like methyltransferase